MKVLDGGAEVRGVMGAVVVVAVGEGVDQGVELPEAAGQGVDGVELVAPGGLHAFDAPLSWEMLSWGLLSWGLRGGRT